MRICLLAVIVHRALRGAAGLSESAESAESAESGEAGEFRNFVRWAARVLVGAVLVAADCALGAPPSEDAIDALVRPSLEAKKAPGFVVVVVDHGATVFARGYGTADLVEGHAPSPASRFAIGSLSKQFTAASILQLAAAGQLDLADPLARYFPALPNSERITVQMLLNQTSGLHNYPSLLEHMWPLEGTIAPEKLLAILATDSPDFEPGTRFAYSNANYCVLAAIVERVAHVPYGDYLAQHIFGPLGMTDSGNGFLAQPGTVRPYQGSGWFLPMPLISLDLAFGAGSVVSSARDLARWDSALLSHSLLGPAAMQQLWSPGHLRDGSATSYAMGFVPARLEGHAEVWHNGLVPGGGGYGLNALFPDDQLAIIVLSNGAQFKGEPERIVKALAPAFFAASR